MAAPNYIIHARYLEPTYAILIKIGLTSHIRTFFSLYYLLPTQPTYTRLG